MQFESLYFSFLSFHRYLTDDQLKGPSKVEAYIRALSKGCRCVECMYNLSIILLLPKTGLTLRRCQKDIDEWSVSIVLLSSHREGFLVKRLQRGHREGHTFFIEKIV